MIIPVGLLAISTCAVAQNQESNDPISYSELRSRDVIGQLGIPLGTATEISATIISGDELRTKSAAG